MIESETSKAAISKLESHRFAVFLLFAINGMLYATWAARVPQIQKQFAIGDSTMGLVLITASLGAFVSMPFAAYINNKFGVMKVSLWSSVVYALMLPLMAKSDSALVLFVCYAFIGVGFGLLDVAMNAQAVEVERAYKKPILTSFHAGFSFAMIIGAVFSSVAIKLGLSFFSHMLLASLTALGMVLYAYPNLYPSVQDQDQNSEDNTAFRLPVKATWLIGFIGFCSMMSEASISDWTSKYMLEVAGSSAYMAPWSLAAFSITMTLGRVFGDRFREKISDKNLIQRGALLAFLGLGISLLFPHPVTTILGAAGVGIGLSIAVPIVFSLSGQIPGLSASASLSMVTTISYLGLFIGPAVIGFLTERFDLRIGYSFILVALGVMIILSQQIRTAPKTKV